VLNPSMLLGTVEMTPLEVVQVYTSLANGGFRARCARCAPCSTSRARPLKSFKVQVEEPRPPAAVYQLDRMLTLVTTHGTGREAAARLPRTVIAGKTGTSSDTRDSWFAGFTGSYLAVAWVGYDDNKRHRAHRRRRRAAGVGRHHGEPQVRIVRTRAAGDSWRTAGSASATDSRPRRPAARTPSGRGAEGHGAARQARLRLRTAAAGGQRPTTNLAGQPQNPTGDKIKSWLKNLVH
jgi:membrane peptidoglycan carboxypeptidase